jgi:DNA topoisomerase-1
LERALELLAEPKRSRGRGAAKKPLKELGVHPADEEAINVYDGPYGAYIKHGKVNVSLPEGETVETITLEAALELISAKAATSKTTRKSSTTKKSTGTTKSTTRTKKSASTAKTTKTTSKRTSKAQKSSDKAAE